MDFKKILFKTNEIDVEKALPDAVIFCALDGKIQWVNDKAAEVFETSKMDLLTSDLNDFIENGLNLALAGSTSDKPIITKFKNREIYFDTTVKEVPEGYVLDFRDAVNGDGTVGGTDINTPVNRDKNSFLVKLANDFKSPLQSIIGFSQAMAEGLGGSMSIQQDKYIKIINKHSSDLMYFMSKLVELSRTETGLGLPEYKTFDILNLINSTVRYNEQLYKEKNIKWTVSLAEGMKNTIVSDEEDVKAIMQNLIEVIVKSVEMGDVNIVVSEPDEEYLSNLGMACNNAVLISISCGSLLFSENDLECLFDPYKIVDSSNRKNVLRAITLACVKNIVQKLNGVVWVESKILKNTAFNVLLPQKQQ